MIIEFSLQKISESLKLGYDQTEACFVYILTDSIEFIVYSITVYAFLLSLCCNILLSHMNILYIFYFTLKILNF